MLFFGAKPAKKPTLPPVHLGEPNDSTSESGIWTNKVRPFQGGSKTHDALSKASPIQIQLLLGTYPVVAYINFTGV